MHISSNKSQNRLSAFTWIFEKKQTTSPLCTRCGDPSQAGETVYSGDYLCQRCEEALLRRNFFLSL